MRRVLSCSVMEAKGLTPILNVSDIASTVAWFEKWGWRKLWDWGTPPTFGAVGSGKETCIFLCQGRREAAAGARTPPHFNRRETKRATRVSGCRYGWTTRTRCTSTASPPGWRSRFRQPICPGTSVRCTFGIPMATCSAWAGDSSPRSRNPPKMPASVGESGVYTQIRVMSQWSFQGQRRESMAIGARSGQSFDRCQPQKHSQCTAPRNRLAGQQLFNRITVDNPTRDRQHPGAVRLPSRIVRVLPLAYELGSHSRR